MQTPSQVGVIEVVSSALGGFWSNHRATDSVARQPDSTSSYNCYRGSKASVSTSRYLGRMRFPTANLRVPAAEPGIHPLKIAVAVLLYVALCMLVLVFSPPDDTGQSGLVQTSVPHATTATLKQQHT